MKYPSNAAPKPHSPAPGRSPNPAKVPTPANDNFPKPPKPANDNVRRGARAVGRYTRWLRGGLIASAAAALFGDRTMGTRINLDGYSPTVNCTPGGTTLNVAGNCGNFIVNIPWPAPVTGRPLNVSLWSIIEWRPNGLQMVVSHAVRFTRVANEVWRRPVQGGFLSPLPAPAYDLPPVPALEPYKVPPLYPAGVPAPVPFSAVPRIPANPNAPGGTGRVGGYRPPPRTVVPGGWPINPDASPRPPTRPNELPSESINLDGVAVPRLNPRPHRIDPPKRGEKERKFVAKDGFTNAVMKVIGYVGEIGDAIDAFYEALPVSLKLRRKYISEDKWGPYVKEFVLDRKPTWQAVDGKRGFQYGRVITDKAGKRWYLKPLTHAEKGAQVYKYFDKLDYKYMARALENLSANEVQDRLFGESSGRLNRSLRKSRRYGYDSGRGLQWGVAL